MSTRLRCLAPIVAAATLIAGMLAGCTGSDNDDGERLRVVYMTAEGVKAPRDVYVQVAQTKGYFTGLDVHVRAGTNDLAALAGGEANVAVVDFATAMQQIGGNPTKFDGLRMVAVVHVRTMACIVALKGSGIAGAADLDGREVAAGPHSAAQVLFPAYAKVKAGSVAARVQPRFDAGPHVRPLAAAQLLGTRSGPDAVATLATALPEIRRAYPNRLVELSYAQAITNPAVFGDTVWVREDFASRHRRDVQVFVEGLLLGLKDAMADPQAAARTIAALAPKAEFDPVVAEIAAMQPYANRTGTAAMDPTQLVRVLATLKGTGVLVDGDADADVRNLVFP